MGLSFLGVMYCFDNSGTFYQEVVHTQHSVLYTISGFTDPMKTQPLVPWLVSRLITPRLRAKDQLLMGEGFQQPQNVQKTAAMKM